MVVLWKWDGTKEQIANLTSPVGFVKESSIPRMSIATVDGRKCLKTVCYQGADTENERRCSFAIYVRNQKKFFRSVRMFIPSDVTFYGWANLCGCWAMLIGDSSPFCSGRFQFYQNSGEDYLRIRLYWYPPNNWTDRKTTTIDVKFPRGRWVEWIVEGYLDRYDGYAKHYFDLGDGQGRRLVSEMSPICTLPEGKFTGATPMCWFRQYVDYDCLKVNDTIMYMADMMVYTDPNDNPPDTVTKAGFNWILVLLAVVLAFVAFVVPEKGVD